MKIKGTVYVELALYLGLGLSVLLVWDAVLEQMHHGELLLIAGGLVRDEAIFEGVFLVFFVPCVVVRHLPFLAVSVLVYLCRFVIFDRLCVGLIRHRQQQGMRMSYPASPVVCANDNDVLEHFVVVVSPFAY